MVTVKPENCFRKNEVLLDWLNTLRLVEQTSQDFEKPHDIFFDMLLDFNESIGNDSYYAISLDVCKSETTRAFFRMICSLLKLDEKSTLVFWVSW